MNYIDKYNALSTLVGLHFMRLGLYHRVRWLMYQQTVFQAIIAMKLALFSSGHRQKMFK